MTFAQKFKKACAAGVAFDTPGDWKEVSACFESEAFVPLRATIDRLKY